MATKRSQNKCGSCKDTWYPKGRDLSLKCPNCGSADVRYAGTGLLGKLGVGGLALIALFVLSGNEKSAPSPRSDVRSSNPPTASRPLAADTSQALDRGLNPASQGAGYFGFDSMAYQKTISEVTTPQMTPISSLPTLPSAPSNGEKQVFSSEEITAMERAKRYEGNDPIVRRRLGLPSRETSQLIP